MDTKGPGEDGYYAWRSKEPEPKCSEEGGYKVDYAVGEPSEYIEGFGEVVGKGVEDVEKQGWESGYY